MAGIRQPARQAQQRRHQRAYAGLNPMLLEIHAIRHGFQSRWWGTFAQWHALGCTIRKRPQDVEEGHWGCRVVFYKPVTKTVVDEQTGDEDEERFFVLRTFTVFNADQTDGDAAEDLRAARQDQGQTNDAEPDFAPAEELISATGADIRYGGDRAFYHRPLPMGAFPNHTSGDLHRAAASGDLRSGRRRSTRRLSMNLPTGPRFAPDGTTKRTATPLGSWRRRLPPATSPPNSAYRRARDWATMPPTCGRGWKR